MSMNLKPKKVEHCSLAFDEVAKIHNHSILLPDKNDIVKEVQLNLDDLGFRFHATAKRTLAILNSFIPELMTDVLRESARQAEFEAYLVNNKRAVFESLKACVYQMSLKKTLYCFDLRSSDLMELHDSEAFIKFGFITWDEYYDRDDFRMQIMNAYAEFADVQKTIYPDGALVTEKLFDKYLAHYAKIKSDDYFVSKIAAVAMDFDEQRRDEAIDSYTRIVMALSDDVKPNLRMRVEEVLSKTITRTA